MGKWENSHARIQRVKKSGVCQILRRNQTAPSAVTNWSVAELGVFYQHHKSGFFQHANRILQDSSRAEEVIQDVLVKMLLAAPELKSADHALSYMYRAIQNACIDVFRVEGRRPKLLVLDDVQAEVEAKWLSSGDLESDISEAEDAAIIRQALSMLSSAERAALVMWEVEGRSSSEIANELGIKKSSVRHTVSRARQSLRRVLGELIVDERLGLTALDLLSRTYKRASRVASDASKVALSLAIILFAILGFTSIPSNDISQVDSSEEIAGVNPINSDLKNRETESLSEVSESRVEPKVEESDSVKDSTVSASLKSSGIFFEGLDVSGVPKGFSVTDSSGSLGTAYFLERGVHSTDIGFTSRQIIKTDEGAANIFISQNVVSNEVGSVYSPIVSYGRGGYWIPLVTSVTSNEIVRLSSGNYLLIAQIAVESEVESPIGIVASTKGRDLDRAPLKVVTRLLLNPSKTEVLAQAIKVVEMGAST